MFSGIGREISNYLAAKGGIIYMICRNKERAIEAQNEIKNQFNNPEVYILVGDCGSEHDVRRMWKEFTDHRTSKNNNIQLNSLICNAGALSKSKTLTKEGIETTFATHLLFGTYLLGSLALPTLTSTPDSRLIAVSSGGMYNTKFPSWDVATSTSCHVNYDGQLAYAYAKRGQVLLCERWSNLYANSPVSIVSCHPGKLKEVTLFSLCIIDCICTSNFLMYVYICMNVYCIYIYMYVYINMYLCMNVCMNVCMCMYVYVCMYVCMYV